MTAPAPGASEAWHVRTPEPDELRDFMSPIPLAFGEDIPESEFVDWERVVERDRWFGAVESTPPGLVLGASAAYTYRLTVPGGELGAAGITAVAVRPDHRRRGILTALMRQQLDDARARGEPLAVLWASEGAIYQRFGFGLACLDGAIEVDTRRTAYLRPASAEGRVRLLTEAEAAVAIPPIYEAMRRQTPGALTRSEAWWRYGPLADPEHRRRGAGPKHLAIHEADGVPEGYVIYRVKDDWDRSGPNGSLEVTEAVTLTPRALRGIWRYLFDTDLVRTVKAARMPVPSPLQLLMAEPRALDLVVKDGLWLRLVDLVAALAGRTYGAPDALVFEVRDAFCPWNAGRWRLDATGMVQVPGGVIVEPSQATPDLVLESADLAAMFLGGTRASQLAQAGRIQEVTSGALGRADALFAADRAPWCVSMF